MAEVTRTTAKTYFNTGDTPTEQQFANVMDSVPFPLSDSVFTPLSGTAWDGTFKTLTLSANTALTFSSSKRSGVLIVKQDATGSRTLSINGTSAAINSAANSTSIITFMFNDVISGYVFAIENTILGVSGGVDTTAPTLVSAVINNGDASNIKLTYNEALDAGSTPATTDFDIQVNGVSRNRDSVSIAGAVITIHLISPVVLGDAVTISYLAGGVNKIQDVAGNDAAAFVNTPVTNNVAAGDTTPPTVVSATAIDFVAGTSIKIRMVFSEAVTATTAGWSFTKNGSAYTPNSISGSGTNTIDFVMPLATSTDVITYSYNSTTGATMDSSSNELVSVSGVSVSNSITAAPAYLSFSGSVVETSTGNHIWKGTGSSGYGSLGLSPSYLPSGVDGYIALKRSVANPAGGALGFNNANVAVGFAGMEAGVLVDNSGIVYKVEGGTFTAVASGGSVLVDNEWVRVRRQGSAFKIERSTDESNWTLITTLTYTGTGDMYVCMDCRGGTDNLYIVEPKGYNLS